MAAKYTKQKNCWKSHHWRDVKPAKTLFKNLINRAQLIGKKRKLFMLCLISILIEAFRKNNTGEMKKMTKEADNRVERSGDDLAVVLIGHGSTLPYNKDVLVGLQKKLEMRDGFKDVKIAFMQLNSPSIEEVLRSLAESGIKKIVALPVFVADGEHTTKDIPEKLKIAFEGEWEEIGRDVELIYGKPMGVDDRIVDILADRTKEARDGSGTPRS